MLSDPYRCAKWISDEQAAPITLVAGKTNLEISGRTATLRIDDREANDAMAVAFVADARGARAPTVARLRALAEQLEDSGVHLVISLGGMGRTEEDLYETLGALSDAAYAVVAIPGDRESIPAHRAALARLTERGVAIVDGSLVRIVASDGVTIGTFPGVAAAQQLVAQSDGCQHFPEDAAAFAAHLADHDGLRVWAGYAPPRQTGESGSDMTVSGIHIGEPLVATAVAAAGAHLVVHGLVDESPIQTERGEFRVADGARLILGTGSVDTLPVRRPKKSAFGGSVLVGLLSARRVRWRRISFDVGEPTERATEP